MGDEQSPDPSPVSKFKMPWRAVIGVTTTVLIFSAPVSWWVWWINQPEEYPISKFEHFIHEMGTSSCHSEIYFHCIDECEKTMIVATPLDAVTVKARSDRRQITSVVFSDVDWTADSRVEFGQSAEILVPANEDVAVWEEYLSGKRSEVESKKILPRRVVPDASPKPAEAPVSK